MRLVVSAMLICTAALIASQAAAAPTRTVVPKGCPTVKAHAGKTSGDWEAVFGRRKQLSRAVSLRNRIRHKGFRCAVIEKEHKTHEVAIVGLQSRSAAANVVARAHRMGLFAYMAQS
jgi:cell division septation protein DedD